MMDLLKDYCYYFLHLLESKFSEYRSLLEEDIAPANKTTVVGTSLATGATLIPVVGKGISKATKEGDKWLSNRKDKMNATSFEKLVKYHVDHLVDSQKVYLSVAYELFACYEKQFEQVSCEDGFISIKDLAYHAVESFNSVILKCPMPSPRTSASFRKTVFECILKNKGNRCKNVIEPGRTVKKTQPKEGVKEETWKCRDIYTKVGVYHSKKFFVNKETQTDVYGFRLAFTFETLPILEKTYYVSLNEEASEDFPGSYTFSPDNFESNYPKIDEYFKNKPGTDIKEVLKKGFTDSKTIQEEQTKKLEEVSNKLDKLLQYLSAGTITDNNKGFTSLMGASTKGDGKILNELLEKSANVNAVDPERSSALIYAAANGHVEIIEELLNRRADVNEADIYGKTSLICAAANGHLEIVEVLLKHSTIDVNAQDKEGSTALIWAAGNNHLEIVEALCQHKAIKVNAFDKEGSTALIWAAGNGHLETAKELIRHGADLNAIDNNQRTALMWAEFNRHLEIVKLLNNVMVNTVDNKEVNPLNCHASNNGNEKVVEGFIA